MLLFIIYFGFWTSVLDGSVLLGVKVHTPIMLRKDDVAVVYAHSSVKVTLFGTNVGQCQKVVLTKIRLSEDSECQVGQVDVHGTVQRGHDLHTLVVEVTIHDPGLMFFCLFCNGRWIFQGTDQLRTLYVEKSFFWFPIWVYVIIILALFVCSALFSGLNLSLMTFQPATLEMIKLAGTAQEKRFATQIYPVRKLGNILLCSLLMGNVLVNSALTVIIEKLIKNVALTLCLTTFGIVIVCEIIPQAFGARYALSLSARTIWITIFVVILTFVLAYPIGKLLNHILGNEIRQSYSKEKLRLIIKEQEKLGFVMKDEAEIISGALTLDAKTVYDVMTPISNAYMINYHANLDFNTMKEIVSSGYTRIPVYDNDKNNIKGILNIKDLTFIDPQDNIPVSTICKFYNRPIIVVSHTTKLPELLQEFRQGEAHLAFVQKIVTCETSDPYEMFIGLITLEDVIEEIIQDEIMDETDIFTDNTYRRRLLTHEAKCSNFGFSTMQFQLSPQLYEATFYYIMTKISSFDDKYVNKRVLESLLTSKILLNHDHKIDKPESNILIKSGMPIVHAILIIQGKVSVKINSENLILEGGPFMFFGETVLKNINNFMKTTTVTREMIFAPKNIHNNCKSIPDYTVVSLTNLQYVCISAAQYLLARYLSLNMPKKNLSILKSEKYYEDWNDLREVKNDEQ